MKRQKAKVGDVRGDGGGWTFGGVGLTFGGDDLELFWRY